MSNKILVTTIVLALAVFTGFYFFKTSSNPPQQNQKMVPTSEVNTSTDISPSTATSEAALPKTYNISIYNFNFDSNSLIINKGDTVVWTNNDSAPHQIVGDSLNGPVMSKGQTYSFTFNDARIFNYHCSIHPGMKGVVTVK